MTHARLVALGILCLGTSILSAGDFLTYRGFDFGMNVAVAAKQAGLKPADVRMVHQRPAVIQEMDWQPSRPLLVDATKADPVEGGLLSFYNGELFRIVITYDRYKIEGMSTEDMIEAISASYGTATRPKADIAYRTPYGDVAPVLARWEDAQYSYNLVQSRTRSSFALVLFSKQLDALAQASIVEAVRLEALDAPQREIEKQQKRDEDDRLALDKARSVNKPNFRP